MRHVEHAVATVERTHAIRDIADPKWIKGMMAHWTALLGRAFASAPEGSEKYVRSFRKRLKALG